MAHATAVEGVTGAIHLPSSETELSLACKQHQCFLSSAQPMAENKGFQFDFNDFI